MEVQFLKKIRTLDYEGIKRTAKFYLIIMAIVIIILFLIIGVIQISAVPNFEAESSLLWTLLNAFIFGVYLSFCGFMNKGIKKEYKKWILLFLIFMALSGFGVVDFEFTFNIPFITHRVFSASTINGVLFFISPANLAMFLGFWLLTFATESEVK